MSSEETEKPSRLVAHDVTLGYDDRTIVEGLSLDIPTGQITVIVGANGCGKSTLLRGLSRLLRPRSGQVLLDGESISARSTREVAKVLGLLPQSPATPEGVTVGDLVMRGRHPHRSFLGRPSPADETAVAEALTVTDTLSLVDRDVDELSGGQRQRVWIAMALAQHTDLLLLDEPTSALDVTHALDVLELLADLNQRRGTSIVIVLHDLNLAARYADHLVVMRTGSVIAAGPPAEVVTEEVVAAAFDLTARVVPDPVTGTPLVVPIRRRA